MGLIDNYLHTVLPFYDQLDKQNFRRAWCDNDFTTFKLICGVDRLLPFQIRRAANPAELAYLKLFCISSPCNTGGQIDVSPAIGTDVLPYIPVTDLTYTTAGMFDYITYLGLQALTYDLPCGQYYLEANDGTDTWYSEVITIEDFTDDTLTVYRSYDRVGIRATNGDLRIVSE